MIRRLALALVLACLGSFALAQGSVIAIGGALKGDNEAVWQRVVDEAGGRGARIAVFATGAGNPERAAGLIVDALNRRGAVAEHIPVAPRLPGFQEKLKDPALIEKVRTAQGVYFAGGAQDLIVSTLQPAGEPTTEMLKAIWSVYRRGGVIAGSSAGAAVMSTTMIRDAPSPLLVLKGQMREGQEFGPGLGFAGPGLLIDQHFLKRGRIGRLLPLMPAMGYQLGLGVEENSAVVLRGEAVEVIGAKGALLVDLRESSSDGARGAFNLRNAVLSYLDHGDRHNLKTGLTTPSADKLKEPQSAPEATTERFYFDMLGDSTIVSAMARLMDSKLPELRGVAFAGRRLANDPNPELGFEFRLYKGEGSAAWFSYAAGSEEYTLLKLRLDVQPVLIRQPFYTPLNP